MYSKVKQGLVIVNTGNGKGKSTSAFGMILRSWGRGFHVCVVNFIKAETGKWDEIKAAKKLGIDWLKAKKPVNLHLVITGRDAPASLVDYADLVTEMQEIKHPFQKGILAQAGVEF